MTATNRLLLGLVVLSAAVSAFWFLALAPKRDEAVRLGEQIAAQQAQIDSKRQQVASYEQARAAYPLHYSTVARLGKAVPADDDVRSLMVQLDAAAERSGVGFELIDIGKNAPPTAASAGEEPAATVVPGATGNPAGFSILPMSFAFHGTYFRLSDFLARLERFVTVRNQRIDVTGRLLVLQSITLVPDTEKGFPDMRAEIAATSYLVPAAQGLTAGATPEGPGPAGSDPAAPAPATAPAPTPATVTPGVAR